ncbi:hypothetical protein [Luteolibacter soli]|uniref:Uncharacterized protein n=1 Tax=Luteolibacter soli TaxID=3135280 RepID=A0ABU9AX54_9BACT
MNALADGLESAARVELPIVWVLGIVGSLATVVTVLAKLIYSMMNRQIDAMGRQIERLQARVDRLQKGCGVQGCAWKS